MFIIECPWCGKRDQTEFTAQGEANIARPLDPYALTDAQWGNYVFFRSNEKGLHHERWTHTHGCRRWFNVTRNTYTDHIYGSYKPGEKSPVKKQEACDESN